MKNIKLIFSFVLLLAVAIGCTISDGIDQDLSFVTDASAPTNVTAHYSITQDNTGVVTLTPNSDGAVSYKIYYGDTTTGSATVSQGEYTTHTYAEGTYTVTIVATGLTGLETTVTQTLVVSFNAPENLVVAISNDTAVSKKVNVTATADNATTFDVYFGEFDTTTAVSANIGDTASYTYTTAGTYTIKVVAKGAAIATTEYSESFVVTEIDQPTTSAATQPSRSSSNVISIFSAAYTDVSGTNYNPDWGQSGQGSSYVLFDLDGDEMLQYINLSYQGVSLGETIDVSSMEYLHMDVWTSDVTSIETSLINGVDGSSTENAVSSSLTAGEWNTIDIPISDYTSQGLTVNQIFQLKFVGTPWAGGTVYVDNIYFYKS